jgi:hypothetical protein
MKFYELAPFDLRLTVDTVLDALREDERNSKGGQEDNGGPHDVRESAG